MLASPALLFSHLILGVFLGVAGGTGPGSARGEGPVMASTTPFHTVSKNTSVPGPSSSCVEYVTTRSWSALACTTHTTWRAGQDRGGWSRGKMKGADEGEMWGT